MNETTEMNGFKEWIRSPAGAMIVTLITSIIANQSITLSTPSMRADSFTQTEYNTNETEQDKNTQQKIENRVDVLRAKLKLYVNENFLPRTTRLPPPEVESAIKDLKISVKEMVQQSRSDAQTVQAKIHDISARLLTLERLINQALKGDLKTSAIGGPMVNYFTMANLKKTNKMGKR